MPVSSHVFTASTQGQGLYEITDAVLRIVQNENAPQGLCTVFIRHTSASLTIQENADPSAKRDLEAWLKRLVPERDSLFTHTAEGEDDMPSHIKSALTNVSLSIAIVNGSLTLGRWQGIYLWEHRDAKQKREIAVTIVK